MEKTAAKKPPEKKGSASVAFATSLRLALTLAFLGLFTLANFLLQNHQINLAKNNIEIIAFFENQLRLTQQIMFSTSLYAQSINVQERKALRQSIRTALGELFVLDRTADGQNVSAPKISRPIDPKIRRLYLNAQTPLNGEVEGYIASIKSFMMNDPIRMSSENPRLQLLQKQSLRLISIFQEAIRTYQKKNQGRVESLRKLGIALSAMTLLCLALIGIFIFLPASEKIARSLGQLETTNEALEKIVAERTDALRQNALELEDSNKKLRQQIDERIRAEQELRKTNAFLDSIIENIPNMIFIKDAEELRFVLFNRAGEELVGQSRNELLGKNDYDFFTQEEADFFTAKDRKTILGKELLDIPEEPIHTRKKGVRLLHTKKIPIMDPQGRPTYLLGISEDITEQLHAEQKMRELSMAMENALDGVARLDMNMKFLSANKAYALMLGYSQEELVGLNYIATLCPEDHDRARASLDEMMAKGKAETEVKAIKKDGSIFHQYAVFVRILDKDKKTEGLYCFTRDVSEQKYRESLEIKSDLIQMVSHELRTPIHSVKEGISIVLEELTGELNEEQREVLSISRRCIDRLARLINGVLAFHKFEAGVVVFDIQKTDLNELLREVGETTRPTIEEKGLSFRLALQENLPEVEMDHDKIAQVLINLIQNAVKFTSRGGITLSSSLCDQGVKISVEDTGIGVQQADLPKLFRKFGQLESAKLVAPGGTGLGLAISKKIVEQHRGTISLESVYKKGSVFSFTLPLTQAQPV